MNVEDGLVRDGNYANGIEFTRSYGSEEDGDTYTDTYNNGDFVNFENGVVVGGSHNGVAYTRTDIIDGANYSQRSEDGTFVKVEDGKITSGVYNNGTNFTRTYSADNTTYTDTYDDGTTYSAPNPGANVAEINGTTGANQTVGSSDINADINTLGNMNNELNEFILMDTDLARASEADLQVDRAILMDEILQSDSLDGIDRPNLITQKVTSENLVNLNEATLVDLENQMGEFLALDTDLARASAADTRVQISTTKQLIDFHRSNVEFYDTLLNS
ncbi:MAG: hypothetical protein HRT47_03870 [Candidatus Caenarcaniphilales bacterium]|nr:hypothetical protein [Candidatus Caenarcaniphilales bacterium]